MPTSTGLRFVAKTLFALIIALCLAFPVAARKAKLNPKTREACVDGAHRSSAAGACAALGEWESLDTCAEKNGRDCRPLSENEAREQQRLQSA